MKHLVNYLRILLLVGVGLTAAACCIKQSTSPTTHDLPNSGLIRIGTYNVFTGARDANLTRNVIRQMHADVVMLQELSPRGVKLLDRAMKTDFPYRHFSEGAAILSRFPLKNPRYQQSQHGINGFLFAEIESPSGRFQVASLHLDPLRIWTTREKWSLPAQLMWGQSVVHRREVNQIINALRPGLPMILAGDFNSASGAAIHQLRKLGFTDSFAAVTRYPDQTPTLHFKVLGIQAGRRIDYIFHDRSFETIKSQVLAGSPSDHDPVVSELRWNREQ